MLGRLLGKREGATLGGEGAPASEPEDLRVSSTVTIGMGKRKPSSRTPRLRSWPWHFLANKCKRGQAT